MLIHKETGIYFDNRKQAKKIMGCLRYMAAVKNGEFTYINKEGNRDSK